MTVEKKSRLINAIALVEIVLTIVIMSVGLLKGYLTNSQSNIVVGTGLVLFWVLSDIVEPFACKRLSDLTFSQKEAYVKFIVLDLIGYAGVLYFLTGIGGNKSAGQSGGLLGAIVYVVTMKPKRNCREVFLGLVEEEQEEKTTDETEAAEAIEVLESDTEEQ